MALRQPEAKRVGIWVRVSTEDQVRGDSPEVHERRARHYAEAKGWTVAEVYRLDAVSGLATAARLPLVLMKTAAIFLTAGSGGWSATKWRTSLAAI